MSGQGPSVVRIAKGLKASESLIRRPPLPEIVFLHLAVEVDRAHSTVGDPVEVVVLMLELLEGDFAVGSSETIPGFIARCPGIEFFFCEETILVFVKGAFEETSKSISCCSVFILGSRCSIEQ